MSRLYSKFGQALIIAAVVGTGAWIASPSEPVGAPQACFSAASTLESGPIPTAAGRVDWQADGQMALLTYGSFVDRGLTLYDLRRKAERTVADVGLGPLSAARLSQDGRHVLLATQAGALSWIDVLSPDSPAQLAELPSPQLFRSMAIATSGEWIAAGSTAGTIQICNPAQAGSSGIRIAAASHVADVQFSRDDLLLASAHADGSIRVWDVATGKPVVEFAGHDRGAFAAAFLPDGQRIISAGADDTLRMWEIASGNELWRQDAEPLGARTLAVAADGTLAAWTGHNQCIVVWDVDRGESKFEIFTTACTLSQLSFSPDGSLLAAVEADDEKSVCLYDMQCGKLVRRISMDGQPVP
jgi:WD40 repeat protein